MKHVITAMPKTIPQPIFDTLTELDQMDAVIPDYPYLHEKDYRHARRFLLCYKGSLGTFNSYRREVEKLLQWAWLVANKPLPSLDRDDMITFIQFCQKPPAHWITTKKAPRFIEKKYTDEPNGSERTPNPQWRPFVATVNKRAHRMGKRPHIGTFTRSQGSLKESFAILNSFYQYLLQEDYVDKNPLARIRQKSQFLQKQAIKQRIRRLTPQQWQYIMKTIQKAADNDPARYERCLFILSALYAMYLRISELVASPRWTPTMNDFYCDDEKQWWFITVGKGNKQRQIAVSDAMLTALRRWRSYLDLTPLPSAADQSPILPKSRGHGPIHSTTYLREMIQDCFNQAAEQLKKDGFEDASENLHEATVHWLRHTGISDDIKHRPREHVRDDAGHTSSLTTDKYVDILFKERHRSARHKPMTKSRLGRSH